LYSLFAWQLAVTLAKHAVSATIEYVNSKLVHICRALRTQQFLEFTAADLAAREAKQRVLWAAFEASRRGKVVSKAELDEFYARMQVRHCNTLLKHAEHYQCYSAWEHATCTTGWALAA
jgi:hypothetical protein